MTDPSAATQSLPAIEFWFEFGSNYSYLSVMRIEALAASKGVSIRWKPFLLGAIFKSFGWTSSPFVLQKAKGEYVWQDMRRQCRKYGLPWVQPSVFPRPSLLPMRVAMLGAEEPWIGDYCKQIMLMNFARDREIDTQEAVSEVLQQLGLPAEDILAKARSEDNKLRLRAQTEEAQARGVFGAPTFFVGSEMFWGDDRLEDALALAESS
jgi:2-hydroxychromene-2-carboxylate isomerase